MKQIFKYPLKATDIQNIYLPKGAEILSVQVQFDRPCLWALVNHNNENENRIIITHGTGHIVNEESIKFIDTYQLANGTLVFHVFEKI